MNEYYAYAAGAKPSREGWVVFRTLLLFIVAYGLCKAPTIFKWPLAWLLCGTAIVIIRAAAGAASDTETSFIKEIVYMIRMPEWDILDSVLFWPALLFPIFFRMDSVRMQFRSEYANEVKNRDQSWGMKWDTAHENASRKMTELDALSDEVGERIEEVGTEAKITTVRYGLIASIFGGIGEMAAAQTSTTNSVPKKDDIQYIVVTGPQHGYLARRLSEDIFDGWMQWTDCTVIHSSGLFVDVWNSVPISRSLNYHNGTETDFTMGWAGSLGSAWNLKVFASYMDLYPETTWLKGDFLLESATVSRSFTVGPHTLTASGSLEWLSGSDNIQGGAYVLMPAIADQWTSPFGIRPLSLNNQLMLIHDSGLTIARTSPNGLFFRWDAALNWKISPHVTLQAPSVGVLLPVHQSNDGRDHLHTTEGTAIKFSF